MKAMKKLESSQAMRQGGETACKRQLSQPMPRVRRYPPWPSHLPHPPPPWYPPAPAAPAPTPAAPAATPAAPAATPAAPAASPAASAAHHTKHVRSAQGCPGSSVTGLGLAP